MTGHNACASSTYSTTEKRVARQYAGLRWLSQSVQIVSELTAKARARLENREGSSTLKEQVVMQLATNANF
ncbi:hypothetical protein OS42_24930 [Dickeya oryzae]